MLISTLILSNFTYPKSYECISQSMTSYTSYHLSSQTFRIRSICWFEWGGMDKSRDGDGVYRDTERDIEFRALERLGDGGHGRGLGAACKGWWTTVENTNNRRTLFGDCNFRYALFTFNVSLLWYYYM
jgi:hypothetical protein